MTKIRLYTEQDYPEVSKWLGLSVPVPKEIYPLESTYILEHEGQPILLVCIYYTSCPTVAFMENFSGNPLFKGEKRKELGHTLLKHCEDQARLRGVTRLIGQSANAKLTQRWLDLGFKMQVEHMSSLIKEI